MNISNEQIVDTFVVHGVTVEIQRITWKNDPGLSFDIIADGEMLTDESFDEPPTGGQVLDVLREHATTFCRFCGRGIIGNEGHLIGNAEPGTNPWCCDDDWDERLRLWTPTLRAWLPCSTMSYAATRPVVHEGKPTENITWTWLVVLSPD